MARKSRSAMGAARDASARLWGSTVEHEAKPEDFREKSFGGFCIFSRKAFYFRA